MGTVLSQRMTPPPPPAIQHPYHTPQLNGLHPLSPIQMFSPEKAKETHSPDGPSSWGGEGPDLPLVSGHGGDNVFRRRVAPNVHRGRLGIETGGAREGLLSSDTAPAQWQRYVLYSCKK